MSSCSDLSTQLREACHSGEIPQIHAIFASDPIGVSEATEALKDAPIEPAVLRALLAHGADVGVVRIRRIPRSEQPKEILRVLASHNYDFRINGHRILEDFARDRETLDWLLDRGVDINRSDEQRLDNGFVLAIGETDDSLHLLNKVAADGDMNLFDHLVDRGAQPGKSLALHAACRCSDQDKSVAMVRHLLDVYHMDINSNDEDFRNSLSGAHDIGSPLCSAIINRNLPAVEELLRRGADPAHPYQNPISYAVKAEGFLPALEPLLRAGVDPTTALTEAVGCLNVDAMKSCLALGADPGPGLRKALEQEESRLQEVTDDAAFREEQTDLSDSRSQEEVEEDLQEARETETRNKMIIILLQSAIAVRNGRDLSVGDATGRHDQIAI